MGRRFKVTRERIRQIEAKATRKIEQALKEESRALPCSPLEIISESESCGQPEEKLKKMNKERIGVKICISEVMHGGEYRGTIRLDNQKFQYQLRFDVNPNELDRLADSDYEESMRNVHFLIRDTNGNQVTIDDMLKTSFMLSTCELAFDLFRNPQRNALFEKTTATYPILKQYLSGIDIAFEMEKEFQMPISPELINFLDAYKK